MSEIKRTATREKIKAKNEHESNAQCCRKFLIRKIEWTLLKDYDLCAHSMRAFIANGHCILSQWQLLGRI